jgi:adenine-specific DNA-methyltransferase
MDPAKQRALTEILLGLLPADGTPVGNQHLRQQFVEAARSKAHKVSGAQFDELREALVAGGVLAKGKGRGGSVRRAKPVEPPGVKDSGAFALEYQSVPAEALKAKPKQTDLRLHTAAAPRATRAADGEPQILSYRHPDKRKNNPQVGLVNETTYSDACINCGNEFPLFVSGVGKIQLNSGMCRQ